jgi:PAS domain S-box-containing protein
MTTARGFRDTVPMDLLQGLPPLRSVPVRGEGLGDDEDEAGFENAVPSPYAADRAHATGTTAVGRAARWALNRLRLPQSTLLLPELARALMNVVAVAAAVVTLLLLASAAGSAEAGMMSVPWALLVLAAVSVARWPQAQHWRVITVTLVGTAVLVAATAWALDLGMASPTLSVLGLLVCAASAMAGWRAGMAVAAVSVLGLVALAWTTGPETPPPGLNLAALQLGTQLLVIAVGMACGTLLARALASTLGHAREGQQRFSQLLDLTADAYWELGPDYRLVSVVAHGREGIEDQGARPTLVDGLQDLPGSVPWDLPQFACDATTLDDLLADLDGRTPFHNRAITWMRSPGDSLQLLVSGEPRFDHRGVFTGFWGVVRDVTDLAGDRLDLQATAERYHELFARTPSPLLVHRALRVVDANPAALQLLGCSHLQDLLGVDLAALLESTPARDHTLQQWQALQHQAVGSALPVADVKLQANGRSLALRVASVCVPAAGGPAVLSIFVNDTDRLVAEEAARSAEVMLSQLVTTSLDAIMVMEAPSGRLVMVNQAFEKTTGYNKKSVLGRPAAELPLWAEADSQAHLQALLTRNGSATALPAVLRAQDGRALSMRLTSVRYAMNQHDYVVLNAHDVTPSERASLQHNTIITHAPVGIAITRQGRFEQANPHFERLFGAAPGALVGQALEVLWSDTAAWAKVWPRHREQIDKGQPVSFEVTARRLDGSSFVAFVRARSIDPPQEPQGGTAWMVEDVTERRQFEQRLAQAREEAETASRAKSAFLANTSHELRTPLSGLMGLIALAREPQATEAQRNDYLMQIADNAQQLRRIINDMLDVAKIEAGKLLLEATVFDLGRLLLELQTTYAPQAQAHRLSLHFDLEPDVMGSVQGDALRVRQILSNYLANAIRFTPSGQVRLRVFRLPNAATGQPSPQVRFEVHDTGPGLSQAAQAQLFKPFSQVDQSSTRRFGGAGLGLSINRELATLMNGEVGVISDTGQGSIFWAELPLPPRQPTPPAPPRATAGSLQGLRVLMVEDNPVNMLIAVALLERWGVVVTQAHNGLEAVQAVRQAAASGLTFDAAMMDVQMPEMNGHEATREIRKLPTGRDLPIVALTAAALVSEREEALRAGMNDFLTKPIDAEKLRLTLQRCCATFI